MAEEAEEVGAPAAPERDCRHGARGPLHANGHIRGNTDGGLGFGFGSGLGLWLGFGLGLR